MHFVEFRESPVCPPGVSIEGLFNLAPHSSPVVTPVEGTGIYKEYADVYKRICEANLDDGETLTREEFEELLSQQAALLDQMDKFEQSKRAALMGGLLMP